MESTVNSAASLQIAAAASNALVCEVMAEHSPMQDEVGKESLRPVDGYITIPNKPGLGISVNEEFVESHILDSK